MPVYDYYSFVSLVRQHIVYIKTVLFLAFDSSLVARGNVRPGPTSGSVTRVQEPGRPPPLGGREGTSDW